MVENLFETHYDVTKKSKIKRFYETNKILIFIVIFIFLFSFASIGFYLKNRENKIILLSNNYIEAKVLLENGKKEEATNILKNIILANNKSYSTKKEKLYNKKIFIMGINQRLELQIKVNYLTIIKSLKLEGIIH